MPISKETLIYPDVNGLKYYSELKPNIQKQEDLSAIGISRQVTHTINTDGLNERYEYSTFKPPGVFRIISLGDSFTEGAFVSTEQNYSEVLEDMLNSRRICPSFKRFDVINFGVEGYDMQYNVEHYKRKAAKYDADLIVLWTNENDFTESNERLNALSSTFDPLRDMPEDVEQRRKKGDYNSALTVLIEQYYKNNSRQDVIDDELRSLRELILSMETPLIIFTSDIFPDDIASKIKHLLSEKTFFFPTVVHGETDIFPDGHPSEKGHKQLAEFLFNKIANLKMYR